jgi:hypothetical protein
VGGGALKEEGKVAQGGGQAAREDRRPVEEEGGAAGGRRSPRQVGPTCRREGERGEGRALVGRRGEIGPGWAGSTEGRGGGK